MKIFSNYGDVFVHIRDFLKRYICFITPINLTCGLLCEGTLEYE